MWLMKGFNSYEKYLPLPGQLLLRRWWSILKYPCWTWQLKLAFGPIWCGTYRQLGDMANETIEDDSNITCDKIWINMWQGFEYNMWQWFKDSMWCGFEYNMWQGFEYNMLWGLEYYMWRGLIWCKRGRQWRRMEGQKWTSCLYAEGGERHTGNKLWRFF